MTEAPTSEDRTRQRRFITAVLVGVVAVGFVGMMAAFFISDDGGSPTDFSTPGASIDPLSVEGKCRSEGIVRFEITPDPDAAVEFTATGAAEPWVEKGETPQTTNTGEDTKLVAIGTDGKLPRVVLTVERKEAAWVVTKTAGCLDKGESSGCFDEKLTVDKSTYTWDGNTSAAPVSPGKYLGNGKLTFRDQSATLASCYQFDRDLYPRGTIAPVSAFAVEGRSDALITDDHGARFYAR